MSVAANRRLPSLGEPFSLPSRVDNLSRLLGRSADDAVSTLITQSLLARLTRKEGLRALMVSSVAKRRFTAHVRIGKPTMEVVRRRNGTDQRS